MMLIKTLEPSEAPASPRRLAQHALSHGFTVLVSEARDKDGTKAWAVVGARETGAKRFHAYWAATPQGGCKAVGQLVDEGKGTRDMKAAQLHAWIAE